MDQEVAAKSIPGLGKRHPVDLNFDGRFSNFTSPSNAFEVSIAADNLSSKASGSLKDLWVQFFLPFADWYCEIGMACEKCWQENA